MQSLRLPLEQGLGFLSDDRTGFVGHEFGADFVFEYLGLQNADFQQVAVDAEDLAGDGLLAPGAALLFAAPCALRRPDGLGPFAGL